MKVSGRKRETRLDSTTQASLSLLGRLGLAAGFLRDDETC